MSKRTLDDVSREYGQQCQVAGDVQYRISILQSDLKRMNEKLQELNKEAAALQAAQPEVTDVIAE